MSKTEVLLLLFIILLGAFLRIYNIGEESFWLDETATAIAVKNHGAYEILKNAIALGNVTPGYWEGAITDLPFYFVLMSFWAKLFGISEAALRLFSALFGSLSILMVFFVAKELVSRNAAFLSSFIFSISMVNIQYSQEARLYSFLVFIVLSSVYFLIKSLKTGRLFYLSIFTAANIIGLYTHFTYVFFIFSQGLYILAMLKIDPRHVKRILVSLFAAGLSYLPWLPRLLDQADGGGAYIGKPTLISALKVWFNFNTWVFPPAELQSNIYSRDFLQISVFDWILIVSAIILAIVMTIFFIIGVLNYRNTLSKLYPIFKSFGKLFELQHFAKNRWVLMLLFWFFAPLLMEFILSAVHPTATLFGPIRYSIFIIPAYIILVSAGVLRLKWKYSATIIMVIVIASLFPLMSYYANVDKQQWREATSFIADNLKEEEIALINSPTMEIAFDYYYGKSGRINPVSNAMQAAELSKGKGSLWLVLSFDKYFDPQSTIRGYLEKEFILDREENFFDIKVLHYSRAS